MKRCLLLLLFVVPPLLAQAADADEWIDYMHLYKNQRSEWNIINVLWQYHDTARQTSRK